MPRPLSDFEYVQFLTDVQPDSLNLPDWGGIVQWNGKFVLAYLKPMGPGQPTEWALTDITDGIPFGSKIIPVQDYLKTVPTYQPSWAEVFVYSIPRNFVQVATDYAAAAGQAAGQAAAAVVGAAGWEIPLLLVGAVVLIVVLKK